MKLDDVRRLAGSVSHNLFKNSNALAIGMLRSRFRGSGLMFKEHQVYAHGDDVRFIDWKLLAKSRTPYVKTFEEERNALISVVLDASPTMLSGWRGVSKLKAAVEIACLLHLVADGTGDRVRVLVVTGDVDDVPACSGEEGVIRLLGVLGRRGLIDGDGNVRRDFGDFLPMEPAALQGHLSRHLGRNSEVVVLSDFTDFLDEARIRRLLASPRVHCFRLASPLDDGPSPSFGVPARNARGGALWRPRPGRARRRAASFGPRMRTLNVRDRYLETFVKDIHGP